jgi:hypothetical protein
MASSIEQEVVSGMRCEVFQYTVIVVLQFSGIAVKLENV